MESLSEESAPFDTMEVEFSPKDCESIGQIVAGYITALFEKYPVKKDGTNPLIENIKSYLIENSEYDINISNIADIFHYNDVYLGRLFKKEAGKSITEFLTDE